MDSARISKLLQPFLASSLPMEQLNDISTYIDLLQRWNARVNLTAIRQPEEIVTRHFGESLFAARHLFPAPKLDSPTAAVRLLDIGSGAGFPGLAIKIWAPNLHATLIESNHKKATFLREAIRSLTLTNIDVFPGRAEDFPTPAELVALRAVERFEQVLPTAVRLVAANGRLALLIGDAQVQQTRGLAPGLQWTEPLHVPLSSNRVLLVGKRNSE
jgi:16S rRNA (guanine527-N7)-methyltransferase